MTVEEVAKLITNLDEYEKAAKHLERNLQELKGRKIFNLSVSVSDDCGDNTIYFSYLTKLITKEMFEQFIQQCIDKFNNKSIEIKDLINRMELMPESYDCNKILEKDIKIKMQVEKFYRLRNGEKAICVYEEEGLPRPFKMEVLGDRNRSFYVHKNGEAYSAEDDVMDYWDE